MNLYVAPLLVIFQLSASSGTAEAFGARPTRPLKSMPDAFCMPPWVLTAGLRMLGMALGV